MEKSELERAQERLQQKKQQLGEDEGWKGENSWEGTFQGIMEKRKAQATGSEQQNKQPEVQAQTQNKNKTGAHDQSIADVRKQQMLEFRSSSKETTIPNILGRYPIFKPVKTGRRKYNPEWTRIDPFHKIKEDENIQIWQRHKLLNQHDCTVYIIIRQYADSEFVSNIRKYEILKKMKLYKEGANYPYVENALDRLFGTQYKIKYMDRYIYKDALVQRYGEDEKTEEYIIQL